MFKQKKEKVFELNIEATKLSNERLASIFEENDMDLEEDVDGGLEVEAGFTSKLTPRAVGAVLYSVLSQNYDKEDMRTIINTMKKVGNFTEEDKIKVYRVTV